MGIGAGYGIGIAQAGSGIGEGMLAANRYNDEQDLKKRQMNINELAETRAGKFMEGINKQREQQMKMTSSKAQADVDEYGVMGKAGGDNQNADVEQSGGNATQPDTSANEIQEEELPQVEPVNNLGQLLAPDGNGGWINTVTGAQDEPLSSGIGKASATKSQVKTVGAQPGNIVRTSGGGISPTSGAKSQGAQVGYGTQGTGSVSMSQKSEDNVRQGKAMITPGESAAYKQQYETLLTNADASEARLQSALKSIDARYANDSEMAAFTKANLIAKVAPQIQMMRNNAEIIKQKSALADFTSKAGRFSQAVLGHIGGYGEIDNKWMEEHGKEASELGIDPRIFYGLHKDQKTGNLVNKQGGVFPMSALVALSDATTPWEKRYKAMEDIDKVVHEQQQIKVELARIASPKDQLDHAMSLQVKLNAGISASNNRIDTIKHYLVNGGNNIKIKDDKGNERTVNIPPMPPGQATGDNWFANLGKTKSTDPEMQKWMSNPNVQELYGDGLRTMSYRDQQNATYQFLKGVALKHAEGGDVEETAYKKAKGKGLGEKAAFGESFNPNGNYGYSYGSNTP